ncbi:MAG: alpha/beta hydrolase [Actinomycetota bacterium]|nr:alpha/beta hydrolase [Actinomycetota bacterium]
MPSLDGPNGRLHYLDEGGGAPCVVLLHAFPLSAGIWEPQIAALAPHHRVVAMDLRGFGGSDVPAQREAYSVDSWADDVATLAERLELGSIVLGGLSMGGYVAFAFVRRHRSALGGLILADTRAGADTAEVRAKREHQQRLLEEAGATTDVAASLLEPLVGPTSTRRTEALRQANELLAGNRAEGVIGALEAMKNRPDSTPDLATIDVPTLVVVGEQDQPSPPEVAEQMAAAVPAARLVVVPDAGHLSNVENPEAFNEALEGFLRELRA